MTSDETPSTTRRRIMKAGVVAGAGVSVAAALPTPAGADPGSAVLLGTDNNAGATETVLAGGYPLVATLTLRGGAGKAPLRLAAPLDAELPQELPTGSLVATAEEHLVMGGKGGTKVYVNSTQWANRTLAIRPQRILDTRSISSYTDHIVSSSSGVTSGKLNAGKIIHLTVANVPPALAERATAAYVNITVAGTISAGFLTAYSSSIARPQTSSLNWWGPNQILSNLVEVQLGTYGGAPLSFAIHVAATTSVIVDVSGLILSQPGVY
jgi:hypothetical protein